MSQRVAALDGLRGLAILLVLWLHLAMGRFWGLAYPWSLGRIGVSLFFVLSGYLITTVYLAGERKTLTFWRRRALRIFPAFYLYLAVVGLLWGVGVYSLPPLAFLAAAAYAMNFYRSYRGWPLEHTWSLAIEEQFYLAWPPILSWLGERRAAAALAGLLLAWPLQRYLRTGSWGHPDAQQALFAATFDAIAWGCLAALWVRGRANPCPARPVVGLALLTILLTAARPEMVPTVLLPGLRNAALAALVLWAAAEAPGPGGRLLKGRPLVWLGTRSYSLYLWHLLFMDPRWTSWGWGQLAPLAALLAAELSYRWVERPVLAWRDRKREPQTRAVSEEATEMRSGTGRPNSSR